MVYPPKLPFERTEEEATAIFWDFGGACDSGLDLILYI